MSSVITVPAELVSQIHEGSTSAWQTRLRRQATPPRDASASARARPAGVRRAGRGPTADEQSACSSQGNGRTQHSSDPRG